MKATHHISTSGTNKANGHMKNLARLLGSTAIIAVLALPGTSSDRASAIRSGALDGVEIAESRRDAGTPDIGAVTVANGAATASLTTGAAVRAPEIAATTTVIDSRVGPQRATATSPAESAATERKAPRDKMSGPVAALAAAGGPELVEIVVRYAEQPALFDDEYVASLGGEVMRSYKTFDMRAIRIPAASLEELAIDDNVDWLSVDDKVSFTSAASRGAANKPKSNSVNFGYTGSNVGVAILDTGVAAHADLGASIVQYSFLSGAYPVPDIVDGEISVLNDDARQDLFGHGTHVAGIVTGSGQNSGHSYEGTSLNATVLSLQVLDENGGGSMSDVMAALDWLLVYGGYFDIDVVNLSLGKSISESNTTDPLVIAVEKLWDAGMVVVVAAGNNGNSGSMTITSPGNSRKVITVGSLTDNNTGNNGSDDYVSSFSSMGPTIGDLVLKPDLVAPGNRVVATVDSGTTLGGMLPDRIRNCNGSGCSGIYLEMSGTSMATPLVSAAVALMLEKDPTLSPATVKARLMRSARKLDADAMTAGAGALDIDAAMNETGVMTVEALSPLMVPDSATNGVLVQDTAVLWGDVTWGSGYLFSDGSTWATGYGWTDENGVSAYGYAWTDEDVWAKGYGWTDETVSAKGYGWTDGDEVAAKSLLTSDGSGLSLNDDAPE